MMSPIALSFHSNDEVREIDCGLDRAIFSLSGDCSGDAARSRLFAIVADDFGYLRLGKELTISSAVNGWRRSMRMSNGALA